MPQLLDRPVTCPVLIGRAPALTALEACLERAAEGQGWTALISGEAGIGKSRLVAELKLRAAREGFLTLQGHCFEPDRSFPYAPFLDLLHGFLAGRSPEAASSEFGSSAPELVRLLPDLERWLPGVVAAPKLDPAQEKRRTFLALERFLLGQAARQPALIVLEDLHWSDDTSLEFLLGLARRIPGQRVLLLCTYRDDEVSPSLAHVLASLERERLASELGLARLNAPEVDAMLRATLHQPRPVPAETLHLLFALTEGNPFFLEEVLKSLVIAGEILDEAGAWTQKSLSRPTIPRSVQDAVQRRSEGLSPAARHVLELAAVAGQRFEFDVLRALTRLEEAQLLRVVKDLIAAQLIVEISEETFAFRHALTRQAIYAGLLARERRALHLEIAGLLEMGNLEASFEDLAYHFFQAESWEKALEYGTRAGLRGLSLYASRAALEQFTRAIEAARRIGARPPAALHRHRGQAHATLGEFEAAHGEFEAALEAARAAGDPSEECLVVLALGSLWAGRDYGRSGEHFERAVSVAGAAGDPALLARSLNRHASWLVNTGRAEAGIARHLEALASFEARGDAQGTAETLDSLGMAHGLSGHLRESVEHYDQAITLFRQRRDQRNLASSLAGRVVFGSPEFASSVAVAGRPLEDVQHDALESLELARRIGWRAGEAFALMTAAQANATFGELGRGFREATEALRIAEEINHEQWMAGSHATLGELYATALEPVRASQHLEAALDLARRLHSAVWLGASSMRLAQLEVARGDLERAEAHLTALESSQPPPGPANARQARLVRAELCLARGQPEAALGLLEALIESAPGGSAARPIPTLLWRRGEALASLGQNAEACQALEQAAQHALENAERTLLWRIHRALGRAWGASIETARASAAFAASREAIHTLAATLEDTDLREHFTGAALETLPAGRPISSRQAQRDAHGGLTAREYEVAVLIGQGLSNKKIAQRLGVSERTVSTHVTNILGKLQMTSRAQVIAWAIERGLNEPD